jgi:multiple sugar transport system permease protein
VKHGLETRQARAGWLFSSPALILIGVFFFVPVIAGFILSVTDFDLYSIADPSNARFIGLRNYSHLLTDPVFWKALSNTAYFVTVGAVLSVSTSLASALLVNAKLVRAPGFFRSVLFAPVVTTLVAVAIVWRYLYHPRYGLLNYVLGGIGIHPIDWLGDPHWAMPAIILLSVWKNFGYNMMIFVAGLQGIPEEQYEAARIDGAGAWQCFWRVTLPNLGPTFIFISVLTMIGFFQLFAEPYVMTQGGPLKSTTTIVLMMYEEGFRWWRLGVGAAIAFVLFVITLIGTLVQMRLQRETR